MAKKVTVELVDDVDGTPIADGDGGTVTFSLEGKAYEVDLTSANADKLREALAPFITAGRSVSAAAAAQARPSRRRSGGNSDLAAIRSWAKANGHTVNERGRIPKNVLDAYAAAH
ncbi:histone-like nucleoid-structuring protein Lsr2 [Microbacterium sp.]|uniref:histone-like nucleoid-structuring protein Lsr2 n=1 Tax=Microbacterium sp. TaxID=51671 RepID=UPI00039B34BE